MFLTLVHVPSLIERKRDGGELSADEINYIIANFTRGEIPDYQVSATGDLLSRHG
jgi:thymidine phosphorylase